MTALKPGLTSGLPRVVSGASGHPAGRWRRPTAEAHSYDSEENVQKYTYVFDSKAIRLN
jgi:hypothetical protein